MSMLLNKLTPKTKAKSFWSWGHLLFSVFYLLPTIFNFSHLSTLNISATLGFYITFITLYIQAVNKKQGEVTKLFIAMLLVCIFASFLTTGSSTLFGFSAFIAGFSFAKLSRAMSVTGVFIGVVFSTYITDIDNPQYFLGGSLILSIALFSFGVATRKEHIHKIREQESAKQLEQLAAIAERERIARDLHDILGHSLSSIALKAELANKLNQGERYTQANTEIAQVAELARQLLSDVRSAVSDLKQLNLASQISQLKQRLIEQGFEADFNVKLNALPAKVEGIASLIIKEVVTNLLRHSSTKKCIISITQNQQQLIINVIDHAPGSSIKPGNGLNGIKERAEQLDGKATFTCGDNFSLNVMLPLTAKGF
ncbi:sensor histidine kinase [Pseudoalteromonas sp. SR44-8]|nr:histidine kinase [Pseudoalteromonas sp. SR44-8]MBB1301725.1 sensor histidine kinase [Pseudoalteromonas sp. SR44-8]